MLARCYASSRTTRWPERGITGAGRLALALWLLVAVAGTVVAADATGSGAGGAEPGSSPLARWPPLAEPLRQQVVLIGRVPYLEVGEMTRRHHALMQYLKDAVGCREVRLVPADDYAGIIAKLAAGEIDLAWVGAVSYVLGRQRHPVVPLARVCRDGRDTYRGMLIARRDRGIADLAAVRGRTIAFVEPESASGYVFPTLLLLRSGIDPEHDCTHNFAGSHDRVVTQVLDGMTDVGACIEGAERALTAATGTAALTILAHTDPIPCDPLVCRPDFPAPLRDRFQAALLAITPGSDLARRLLHDGTGLDGFAPAADADYQVVAAAVASASHRLSAPRPESPTAPEVGGAPIPADSTAPAPREPQPLDQP